MYENQHNSGQNRGDNGNADSAENPLSALVGGGDVGLQILGAGDRPSLRVPDPPFVDKEAVDEVHYEQNHQQRPEARPEAARAVDGVHADEHVGDVDREAQHFEKTAVPVYLLSRRKPQRYAALLHILIIQMHHADGSVTDADGADKRQYRAEADALKY